MKLLDIPFDDRRRRYLVFHPSDLPGELRLASTTTTAAFESVASSRFYLSEDGHILAKVVPDKFRKRDQPLGWFCRDYLEKRWLMQSDARKEFLSLRLLQGAGLATPHCHGWGVSLNPCNRNPSLLLLEHVADARMGGEVFDTLSETERDRFLDRLCREVAMLARAGYAHRDLHYNNLLVKADGQLVWIDAHVRRLPTKRADQWPALERSLTINKLRGAEYHERVVKRLAEMLQSPEEYALAQRQRR